MSDTIRHVSSQRGFTLIELIVVATILAVLASVALVSFSTSTSRSRDGKRQADAEQVRSALEMWRSDHGSYPGTDGEVDTVLTQLKTDGYIDRMPTDPKSAGWSDYYYDQNASGATYVLCVRMENPPAAATQPCNPASSCTGSRNYCTKNP